VAEQRVVFEEMMAAIPSPADVTTSFGWVDNAATIAGVGLSMGMPDHAVTVALATALQESGLRNLPAGDRDSAGLFQQRPSQGWGTYTQVTDPVHAATAFYDKLRSEPDWPTLSVTQAAQLVQRSATPAAYARWEPVARSLARAFTGEDPAALADFCATFQDALFDQLFSRLETIWDQVRRSAPPRPSEIALAGGVAANGVLRARMEEWGRRHEVTVRLAEKRFCTDNAAMIAFAALQKRSDAGDPRLVTAHSRMALGTSKALRETSPPVIRPST